MLACEVSLRQIVRSAVIQHQEFQNEEIDSQSGGRSFREPFSVGRYLFVYLVKELELRARLVFALGLQKLEISALNKLRYHRFINERNIKDILAIIALIDKQAPINRRKASVTLLQSLAFPVSAITWLDT